MIFGCKNWADKDTYFSQKNNGIEKILKSLDCPTKLETCGPTAACSCLASMGKIKIFKTGEYFPQQEDILALWFNDFRNYGKMRDCYNFINPEFLCGNEVLQWYPLALKEIFDVRAFYTDGLSIDDIVKSLENGRGSVVCLKKPGHYIAIVAYDFDKNIFIYNDPWDTNPWPEKINFGFNRRIDAKKLFENLKNFRLEVF